MLCSMLLLSILYIIYYHVLCTILYIIHAICYMSNVIHDFKANIYKANLANILYLNPYFRLQLKNYNYAVCVYTYIIFFLNC